ncbi:MAG: Ig-like domain-containing protein [Deltaproteobacteria bacterium]|nr:Ig-like domain-containing protein [Deltaproteobacteria bacterium]
MNLVKVSGDNQTVFQHYHLPDALWVQVLDRRGSPLQGWTVTWTAAPGTSDETERSAPSDQFGWAYFNMTFHVPGNHQVAAAVDEYRPVHFVVHVLPTDGAFDGTYSLSWSGVHRDPDDDPPVDLESEGSDWFSIMDNELAGPFASASGPASVWIESGSFNASDGSLDMRMRMSPDIRHRYTGTLSLDGATAGGAGTWIMLWRSTEVPGTGGTWTAARR